MTRMNKLLATAAVTGLALATASTAHALTATLTPFDAQWHTIVAIQESVGDTVDLNDQFNDPGVSFERLSWGIPTSATPRSAYRFEWENPIEVAVPNLDDPPVGFNIGDFVHENWELEIGSSRLVSAVLRIEFEVEIDGNPVAGLSPKPVFGEWLFEHTETPNRCAPLPSCADDIIEITITELSAATFSYGGVDYLLSILGFENEDEVGTTIIKRTREFGETDVALPASLVATNASREIPVPAALPLLATAMGVMGFAGWRRRRAA